MATELKDRIKVGLDESRMIVLVVQVLLGFECRAAFEPRFDQLPPAAQALKMISFALLAFTLALLLAVPAYHRIAEDGEGTPKVERVMRRFMTLALLPFAAGLGIDLSIATLAVLGAPAALLSGLTIAALALFCWYGVEYLRRRARANESGDDMNEETKPTPLEEKIKQLLTECRIVLPGTQAFLGFQLIAFLTEAFTKLPRTDQLLHLAALMLVGLSGILLMTPPAYHRIAERGEMTQHFHRVASVLLLCAMFPLALGISIDFFVVLSKVTAQPALAFAGAASVCAMFLGFWFVFPYLRRNGAAQRAAEYAAERAGAVEAA